jgi:hypothetical protein
MNQALNFVAPGSLATNGGGHLFQACLSSQEFFQKPGVRPWQNCGVHEQGRRP